MRTRNGMNVLFGSIAIPRGYCKVCDSQSFILDGKFQCCDTPTEADFTAVKRESGDGKRRRLTKEEQKTILDKQNDRCYYCGRLFGVCVHKGIKEVSLVINWDHLSPYSYQANNTTKNFVGACQICNGLKSNMIFSTLEEAQVYLNNRWEEKGYYD